MNLPKKKYISIHEAAKVLDVSTKTLRRWEASGRITSLRTKGGHRRYSLADIRRGEAVSRPRIARAVSIPENFTHSFNPGSNAEIAEIEHVTEIYKPIELHQAQIKMIKLIGFTIFAALILFITTKASSTLFGGYQTTSKIVQESLAEYINLSALPPAVKTILGSHSYDYYKEKNNLADSEVVHSGQVLAAENIVSSFNINIRSNFKEVANFIKGLTSSDVSTGTLEASGAAKLSNTLNVTGVSTFANNVDIAGDLTSPSTTFNLLNTGVTTLNIGGTSTTTSISSTTGTTSINNNLSIKGTTTSAGKLTGSGDLAISGASALSGTLKVTGAATLSSTLDVSGNSTFGNITKINGITYSYPATQGAASTLLINNGSGTLTWSTLSGAGGTLAIANGGTNNTTYTTGSVIYYDGTKLGQDNSNFFWDGTNHRLGLGTASPSTTLHVVGATTLAGATTIGGATTDLITFTGRVTSGTSLIPAVNLGSDLGSLALRWNNLYVGTINSNSTVSTTGQALFTYPPTDTTYAQSSVMINPTAPPANSFMLGIGIAGAQRAGIDAEGDLTLGYAGGAGTSAPNNSNPLSIYNHGTTNLLNVDTSGNIVSVAGAKWQPLTDSTTALNIANAAGTVSTTFDTTNSRVGIGTTSPAVKLDIFNTAGTATALYLGQTTTANNRPSLAMFSNSVALDVNGTVNSLTSPFIFDISGTTNVNSGINGLTLASNHPNGKIIFNIGSGAEFARFTSTGLGIGTTSPNGLLDVSKAISAAPSLTGAYMSFTASTLTDNTAAATNPTNAVFNSIAAPTLAGTNAQTTTNVYGLYLGGAPIKGTNETITNTTALNIAAAAVGAATNSYGLQVNAQTGATNNYAAAFSGGNVGIGTTAPGATLQVSGTSIFNNGSNSTTAYQFQNAAGSNLLNVDTTNTFVGINGATVPLSDVKLGVTGSMYMGGDGSRLVLNRTTAGLIDINYTQGLSAKWRLETNTSSDNFRLVSTTFDVNENNSVAMFTSTGRVGLGTESPVSKLHLTGAVTGKALAIFNETGDQNIFTASQSGIPVFNLARVAGTAANGVTFTPAATGAGPTLASTGSDADIAFTLNGKGNGALTFGTTSSTGAMTFGQSTATNTINIGNAVTTAGNTQTINIGAGALNSTGLTAITIGNSNISTGVSTLTLKAGGSGRSQGPSITLGNVASTTTGVCSGLANATAPTAGTAYELIDCTSNPVADYAEMYPVASGTNYGDVVAVGSEMINTYSKDWTKVIGQVTKLVKSNKAYQNNVIGIVSDNHEDWSSTGYNIKDSDNPMPVALNGRIPVKVASDSSDIRAGDFLTSSNTQPGKAMKADKSGYVIAKALESWTRNSGKDIVMVFVNNTYYFGDLATSGNLTPVAQNPQNTPVDNISLTILNDKLNTLDTKVATIEAQLANLSSPAATDSASLNNRITSLENDLLTFKSVLTASSSGMIASLHEVDTSKLNVLGDAVLGDTVINGKLNVGTLTLDNINQSINAIGILKIQDLALGNVEFMNGLITFDTKGNVIAKSITADKYKVAGTSAGNEKIIAGQTSVAINTNQVTDNSLIFVTAKTTTNKTLAVTAKTTGTGFKVEIPSPDTKDIDFNWWIIDKQ